MSVHPVESFALDRNGESRDQKGPGFLSDAAADTALAPDTAVDGTADTAPVVDAVAVADADAGTDAAADTDVDADTGEDAGPDAAVDADTAVPVDVLPEAAPLPDCVSATDCPTSVCHTAICTPKGTCALATVADGSPCDNGNAYATTDTCTAGSLWTSGDVFDFLTKSCVGTKIPYDDGNPCTFDGCDKLTGETPKVNAPDGTLCGGGKKCAQGKCL